MSLTIGKMLTVNDIMREIFYTKGKDKEKERGRVGSD